MDKLIYVLHSGNLYGTEQMALRTLTGLKAEYQCVLVAPHGPVHQAATSMGIHSVAFGGNLELFATLARELMRRPAGSGRVVCIDTGVKQALMTRLAAFVGRVKVNHVHVVHGGTDERLSYGRKKWLGKLGIRLVAVSEFVRQRLISHGCDASNVTVIPNFQQSLGLPKRASYTDKPSLQRIAVVSRLDPIKRVDLVINAIKAYAPLQSLQFDIYGAGSEEQTIRQMAADLPNVHVHGFVTDASRKIAEADLLLHTCATEPFGLAILEAFEAGVLVMVPNRGGASELVKENVNGLQFAANDPRMLAKAIIKAGNLKASELQAMADAATQTLSHQYSQQTGIESYKNLIGGQHHVQVS